MENYTKEELVANYKKFMKILEKYFEGERLEKLQEMYSPDNLGNRLILAPASGNLHYHSAYVGGYMDHIFNIGKAVQGVKILYEKMGGKVDFTDEEMYFSAIHHDLGKLGDLEFENYIPQDSQWHRENRGELFKQNPDIQFMKVPDRALYLLNLFGIDMTQKEWLSIKLSDGMYEDANKSYLKTFNHDFALTTNLPHIIHWADHLSCVVEADHNYD